MERDKDLDNIRDDPRVTDLLEKIKEAPDRR
jgi:hypothetical protein